MPARIDATPIATIGQPAVATRYRPNALATANAAIIARFIAAALIRPADTARSGPLRQRLGEPPGAGGRRRRGDPARAVRGGDRGRIVAGRGGPVLAVGGGRD